MAQAFNIDGIPHELLPGFLATMGFRDYIMAFESYKKVRDIASHEQYRTVESLLSKTDAREIKEVLLSDLNDATKQMIVFRSFNFSVNHRTSYFDFNKPKWVSTLLQDDRASTSLLHIVFDNVTANEVVKDHTERGRYVDSLVQHRNADLPLLTKVVAKCADLHDFQSAPLRPLIIDKVCAQFQRLDKAKKVTANDLDGMTDVIRGMPNPRYRKLLLNVAGSSAAATEQSLLKVVKLYSQEEHAGRELHSVITNKKATERVLIEAVEVINRFTAGGLQEWLLTETLRHDNVSELVVHSLREGSMSNPNTIDMNELFAAVLKAKSSAVTIGVLDRIYPDFEETIAKQWRPGKALSGVPLLLAAQPNADKRHLHWALDVTDPYKETGLPLYPPPKDELNILTAVAKSDKFNDELAEKVFSRLELLQRSNSHSKNLNDPEFAEKWHDVFIELIKNQRTTPGYLEKIPDFINHESMPNKNHRLSVIAALNGRTDLSPALQGTLSKFVPSGVFSDGSDRPYQKPTGMKAAAELAKGTLHKTKKMTPFGKKQPHKGHFVFDQEEMQRVKNKYAQYGNNIPQYAEIADIGAKVSGIVDSRTEVGDLLVKIHAKQLKFRLIPRELVPDGYKDGDKIDIILGVKKVKVDTPAHGIK